MIAYLRYGFAAMIAVVFVTVAVANRAIVEVKLLPDTLAALLGFNISFALPVFLLLGLAIVIGLLLGFVWEWFREHGYRAEAAKLRREAASMRSELQRAEKVAPQMRKDDVLALIESK
jgi:lipopolysaccharide assembly protein A